MCQLAVVRVIKSANHDGRDCTGDGIRYSESAYWAQYKGIGGITGQGGLAMGGNIASRVVPCTHHLAALVRAALPL